MDGGRNEQAGPNTHVNRAAMVFLKAFFIVSLSVLAGNETNFMRLYARNKKYTKDLASK